MTVLIWWEYDNLNLPPHIYHDDKFPMTMLTEEICQRNPNHKFRPDHNTVTGSCWKILMNGRKVVIYIIFLAQALL